MTRLKNLLTASFESLTALVRPGWHVFGNAADDRWSGLETRRRFIAPRTAPFVRLSAVLSVSKGRIRTVLSTALGALPRGRTGSRSADLAPSQSSSWRKPEAPRTIPSFAPWRLGVKLPHPAHLGIPP